MSEWLLAAGVVFSGFSLIAIYWLGYRAGIKSEGLNSERVFSAALLKYQNKTAIIRRRYDALLQRTVIGDLNADTLSELLSSWQAEDDISTDKAAS